MSATFITVTPFKSSALEVLVSRVVSVAGGQTSKTLIGVFASCTSTGSTTGNVDANCPPDEVYAVSIDLQVNGTSTGKTAGGQSEDNSTVYLLSLTSNDYQAMVG